ncbi:MAG: reverse transcriptase domain-containing protein [Candidatus Thiodiazotropha sp.]
MYSKTRSCVRIGDHHTHFFQSVGVRQGDVLSPNLFKIFINDLPNYHFRSEDFVEVNDNPVRCLIYADDIVLLATSSKGL